MLASVLGGIAGPDWAAGKNNEFREVRFESKELGGTVKLNLWTPPGYENATDRRTPVIYCCQNTGRPVRELARLFSAGKWYEDRGEGIMQLVEKNLGALRDMPILMIDGAWFGDQGVEYRKQFQQAGLRDIRVIDARYLGHGQVFDYWVPQIMTTFCNATMDTIASTPNLVPAEGAFKDRVTVKSTPPRPGMEVFYTTDGSDPRKKQHAAQAEVSVTVPCWLRAIAIGKDGVSKEAVARYELEGTLRPGEKPPR